MSAAATPRFVHKSVHNTARSKCSNRRLRAVTPELGIRINAVPEWWPEVSDPLLTDLTPMRSSPQPMAFNLRRMCCRSLRGLGGAFHGIMDYLVHNRQVPFVTPREPTSSAGRWACRMRLAALPIASAGAEPNAGVGKTRWRPAQVGAASTSWGCKDTVTAAQAAAKSSVALEALEGGQISLAEAAALTEFIVMWTHARVGCQSTVVE